MRGCSKLLIPSAIKWLHDKIAIQGSNKRILDTYSMLAIGFLIPNMQMTNINAANFYRDALLVRRTAVQRTGCEQASEHIYSYAANGKLIQ